MRKRTIAEILLQGKNEREIQFLDGLGTYVCRHPRLALLRRYRDTMHLRDDWADMDPIVIQLYAETLIRREERKPTGGHADEA
jgi:hypothetical protein